jgi:beta propeller repeat protein
MYENRLVSQGGCGENGASPFCVFDTNTLGSYTELLPDGGNNNTAIWGDTAVWATSETDNYNIRAYNFTTSTFIDITNDTAHQEYPRIYGDKVVYMDLKLGDSTLMGDWNHAAVFIYNMTTGITTQIAGGDWIATFPDIYDNIIVWADYRDCSDPNNKDGLANVEIWGYNLDTSTEFQITNLPGREKITPRIWGDKVFVHMYQTTPGMSDAIYMFDLPAAAKGGRK